MATVDKHEQRGLAVSLILCLSVSLCFSLSLSLALLSLFLHPSSLEPSLKLLNELAGRGQRPEPRGVAFRGHEVLASERFCAPCFGNAHTDGHQENASLLLPDSTWSARSP